MKEKKRNTMMSLKYKTIRRTIRMKKTMKMTKNK